MGAYRVSRTDAATDDLKEIFDYVAEYDLDAAERLRRGILEHTSILESFPSIGPAYPRGSRGSLREVVYGSYGILYDVVPTSRQVRILHLWHGALQEPPI